MGDKDFDLDRVVADPKYRRWVIEQLKSRASTDEVRTAAPSRRVVPPVEGAPVAASKTD